MISRCCSLGCLNLHTEAVLFCCELISPLDMWFKHWTHLKETCFHILSASLRSKTTFRPCLCRVHDWEPHHEQCVEYEGHLIHFPGSQSSNMSTKTNGEHQNSWDLWMFIPLKMVLIGIDPYPNWVLVSKNVKKKKNEKNPLVHHHYTHESIAITGWSSPHFSPPLLKLQIRSPSLDKTNIWLWGALVPLTLW